MREINECTAEVFRRSEKRIKEHKRNRNCILALCIPLCLIVTVWSIMILPAMLPAGMDNAAEGADIFLDKENQSSIVCSYTEVEIQDAGKFPERYKKVTDKVEVTKIFTSIHSLFDEVNGADQSVGETNDEDGANGKEQQTDATGKLTGYLITFSTEDGSQTVYNLSNNILLNVNTNETVILTDIRVAELKAALGISE